MAEPHWRVELLGELRVVGQGQTLTRFESRRAAALLAYLALHPQRHPTREELIDRIWPDAPLEAGRNRLKQALSSLRRQLEPPPLPAGSVFEADKFTIGLRPGALTTDVAALEQALLRGDVARAQQLWKGELLPGLYDDWVQLQRERLNALYEPLASVAAAVVVSTHEEILTEQRVSAPTIHLPVPVTRFFGRQPEQERLCALLDAERWVSVLGAGGMGKTRLAIEVGRCWGQGDVWFVPLAELTDPTLLGEALATALSLPLRPQTDSLEQVQAFLGARPALLVLDNAEQLASAGLARPLRTLLEHCPLVRLLVTTRQPLGGDGELLFALEPLPLPLSENPLELALLPSIQLFLDRAQRVRADVGLTPRNAATLAALCRYLDGIPLALELVAAWAQALSPAQILARLQTGDSSLTTSRRRDIPERHRSLHHAFEGSYARLTPAAQRFFTQLSVFRGGGTLEAASAICAQPAAATLFTELAEASLLVIRTTDEPESVRFLMLETLRQFAEERLPEDEQRVLRERHGAYFAALAERAAHLDPEHNQAEWLTLLQIEWENLRAAQQSAPPDRALRLPVALADFLSLRGQTREGIAWLEAALAQPGGTPERRTEALAYLGALSPEARGIPQSQVLLEQALAKSRALRLPHVEAFCLYHLGRLAFLLHELETSWQLHQQSRALREVLDDPGPLSLSLYALSQIALRFEGFPESGWELSRQAEALARRAGRQSTLADILYESACILAAKGDPEGATPLMIDSRQLSRRLGTVRLEAKIVNLIGELSRLRGELTEAREYYRAAARLFGTLRDSGATHFPVWNLGCCFEQAQDWERALLMLACSVRLWEEVGRPLDPESWEIVEQYRQKAVENFGEARTEAIYQRGYRLTLDEALALSEK